MKWTSLAVLRGRDDCIPFGLINRHPPVKEFITSVNTFQTILKLVTLFFFFSYSVNNVFAQDTWNQEWLKQDKAAHMTASAFISAASIEMAKDININSHDAEILGTAVALGVGMSKEFLYDSRPSPYDMGVNIIGCVAGIYLNRWLQKKTSQWVNKQNNINNQEFQLARRSKKYEKQKHKRKNTKIINNRIADALPQNAEE